MTNDDFPKKWSARLFEIAKIVGAVTVILTALIGTYGWASGTLGSFVRAVIALPEWMEAIDQKMDVIEGDISTIRDNHTRLVSEVDRATQPRTIFEIDDNYSMPRGGYCVAFSRCIIDIRKRRTLEGERCEFLHGRDRYFFIDATGQRIEVERLDTEPDPDVGREWFDFHWEFDTPGRLAAPVGFEFQRAYTHCRDDDDEAVITQSSDTIPVQVRSLTNDNVNVILPQQPSLAMPVEDPHP